MRFLKTLTLNRRAIYDDRLAINTSNEVIMNTPTNLLVPKGPTADRPTSPVNGMLRYNTELNEIPGSPGTYYGGLEVYQGSSWRELRYKEPTALKVQYLGVGDDHETTFGPLSPDPFYEYPTIETLTTWNAEQMAQNLLVINEGYWQFAGYDYTIIQNPSYMHPPFSVHAGDPYDPGTYIQFITPIQHDKPVYVIHNVGR